MAVEEAVCAETLRQERANEIAAQRQIDVREAESEHARASFGMRYRGCEYWMEPLLLRHY